LTAWIRAPSIASLMWSPCRRAIRHPLRFLRLSFSLIVISKVLLLAAPTCAQTFTSLYSFENADGKYPYAGVILDAEGNLYGTTQWGGTTNWECVYGCGVVFKITQSGAESVLYKFDFIGAPAVTPRKGWDPDGAFSYASLIFDAQGNLYGTTHNGGGTGCKNTGCGIVFELTASGTENVLYRFSGADGAYPFGSLTFDSNGNLYGTTLGGGAYGLGTVFELTHGGTEKVLHSFSGGADGSGPGANVIFDQEGNLYGTTVYGGDYGQGTVFKITSAGKETVLYTFTGGADGGQPSGNLIIDQSGNLYSTTEYGGTGTYYPGGTVFKLTSTGSETVLHSFCFQTECEDGGFPHAGLVMDAEGNLYGMTTGGGYGDAGIIFEVSKTGSEETLYVFPAYGFYGNSPFGGLVLDEQGNLYGTTQAGGDIGHGTVFKLVP
jgi:uncharacterized repeat protein (TIGR03803 family)